MQTPYDLRQNLVEQLHKLGLPNGAARGTVIEHELQRQD